MLRNYFKTVLRDLSKQKMYAAIKIGGFALGIAACMLIAAFIGAFNHWMKYGALNRGSVPPLSLLHQSSGLKEVNDALLRMECGTF